MQADRLRHEEIVEWLRSTGHAYHLALRLPRGQRLYSGTPSSGARRPLNMMERAGVAERHGRGDWVIPGPLLRSYSRGPALTYGFQRDLRTQADCAARRVLAIRLMPYVLRALRMQSRVVYHQGLAPFAEQAASGGSFTCAWMRRVRLLNGH